MVGCGNSVQNNSNKESYEDLKSKYETVTITTIILKKNMQNFSKRYQKQMRKRQMTIKYSVRVNIGK